MTPRFREEVPEIIKNASSLIPRGNGRCYGDASLGQTILSLKKLSAILAFDPANGTIECQAGILLKDILSYIVPRGFFLPVTPGTKYVSLGGAMAADVHGKNHHRDGCLSNWIESFKLSDEHGKALNCSPQAHPHIFWNTFGAMGRTGVILSAIIKLTPIESTYIIQKTTKVKNLTEMALSFEQSDNYKYSVAWIDCLKKGNSKGRGILIQGNHAKKIDLPESKRKRPLQWKTPEKGNIPFFLPHFFLQKSMVRLFNAIIYHKQPSNRLKITGMNNFFYPLDRILNWNRIYGRKGFIQYQFVSPKSQGLDCVQEILKLASTLPYSSFLSVLKLFGDKSMNAPYSFPIPGYTLSLDIKATKELPNFILKADQIVAQHGGKVYLAKDALSSAKVARDIYPKKTKFQSLQSIRLLKEDDQDADKKN